MDVVCLRLQDALILAGTCFMYLGYFHKCVPAQSVHIHM